MEKVAKINSYPATTVDLGELSFKQGDSVILSLVDVDDAGNASEPAVLAFVAKDTIPPQAPGGFSVALIREEADEPESTVAPNEEPEGISSIWVILDRKQERVIFFPLLFFLLIIAIIN
jgi:hypothetical protein